MLLIFTGLILVEYTWVNAFKYIQVGAFSIISLVFFIDLVLNMMAYGVAETLKKWEYLYESILQIFCWVTPIWFTIGRM